MCELLIFQVHKAGKQGVEKKVCKFEAARPRICNLFWDTLFSHEWILENKWWAVGEIFETVNLDNYSNRLLFLMYQVFTTEQKVCVGLRLLKIRLALRAHKRFSTLMLAPIDFLSCSGFLEKLAEGQFFTRAWAAEKINRSSPRLQHPYK